MEIPAQNAFDGLSTNMGLYPNRSKGSRENWHIKLFKAHSLYSGRLIDSLIFDRLT